MMKNVFCSMLQALFVLEVSKKITTVHIVPNTFSNKSNQTMKSDQLIEYNMRNIFLEKSYIKFGEESNPRSFYKKSKLSISLDQQSKMLYRLFLWYVQVEVYQNILKLQC